jgi:hypothetical protein
VLDGLATLTCFVDVRAHGAAKSIRFPSVAKSDAKVRFSLLGSVRPCTTSFRLDSRIRKVDLPAQDRGRLT